MRELARRRGAAALGALGLVVVGVAGLPSVASAALLPEETLTTAQGLVLGPRAYPAGAPASFVDAQGRLLRSQACATLGTDGTYISVTATNLTGLVQLVLGPPGTAPGLIARDGSTLVLAEATCEAQAPVAATFDLSDAAFAGMTGWGGAPSAVVGRFADGTVAYPASSPTGRVLVALDPNAGSASVLVTLPSDPEWMAESSAVVGPDDRLYTVLTGTGNARSKGLVAITRDGSLEYVIGPDAWGYHRLGEGSIAATL